MQAFIAPLALILEHWQGYPAPAALPDRLSRRADLGEALMRAAG